MRRKSGKTVGGKRKNKSSKAQRRMKKMLGGMKNEPGDDMDTDEAAAGGGSAMDTAGGGSAMDTAGGAAWEHDVAKAETMEDAEVIGNILELFPNTGNNVYDGRTPALEWNSTSNIKRSSDGKILYVNLALNDRADFNNKIILAGNAEGFTMDFEKWNKPPARDEHRFGKGPSVVPNDFIKQNQICTLFKGPTLIGRLVYFHNFTNLKRGNQNNTSLLAFSVGEPPSLVLENPHL